MATSGTDPELPNELREALDAYEVWLSKQPLADRSRDAYRSQVRAFVAWLAEGISADYLRMAECASCQTGSKWPLMSWSNLPP